MSALMENYAGQTDDLGPDEAGQLQKAYGRLKTRRRNTKEHLPMPPGLEDWAKIMAAAGSVIAANILSIEGIEVELDGQPWHHQPAKIERPEVAQPTFAARMQARYGKLLEIIGPDMPAELPAENSARNMIPDADQPFL